MLRCVSTTLRKRLAFGEEVIEALFGKNKKPIVALESTIISHGMPFPQNLEMAKMVEDLVRAQGACPATICIADGELKVGLSDCDLYALAEMGSSARKCSTRDIPAAVSEKIIGATTVSSTMRIAHAAGIRVFVTGGIGGVHRFSEETMDISTDLLELSRTPVAVVCAGIKSILDIPKTLEFLETHSVPVIGYQSDQFPAFFTQDSGMKAHLRRDTPRGCADVIHESLGLELPNGFVVAVPNPNPVSEHLIQHAIQQGLKEVKEQDIQGQMVTPYLLKRLNELTNGVSLGSNIDLVMNNAKVGSQIARALFDMENGVGGQPDIHFSIMEPLLASTHTTIMQPPVAISNREEEVKRSNVGNVLVVGGLVLDIISSSSEQIIQETSNIGTIRQSSGGVGRNIAECLQRLNLNPLLVSAIGDDASGSILLANLKSLAMSTDGIHISGDTPTAVYSAVLGATGNMDVAIADMRALDLIDTTTIPVETIKNSKLVIADGNLSPHALKNLVSRCAAANVPVWFEPTSVQKSLRVVDADIVSHLNYVSPNIDELAAMSLAIELKEQGTRSHEDFKLSDAANIFPHTTMTKLKNDCISVLMAMTRLKNGSEKHVIVTLGRHGVLIASATVSPTRIQAQIAQSSQYGAELWGSHRVHNRHHDEGLDVSIVHLPGLEVTDVIDCTGAGDSLVGGTVYGLLKGENIYESCHLGMIAARCSLISNNAINPELTPEMLLRQA